MPTKDAPLAVSLPAPERDKPAWLKVGTIAAVGFVIGIAWPRIVGVRIGPSTPGESAAAAASASAHPGRAPDAPPGSITKPTGSTAAATSASAAPVVAAPAALPPNITVQKGSVLSCKTDGGETKKGKDCGAVPGIDALVTPRVRKIATCSGVEGQSGKLSLVVNADFASGRFWYEVGKNSNLPKMEAVESCLKTAFHGTSAQSTPHEHPRYTVAYTATFAAPEDDKNRANAKTGADKKEKDEAPPPSEKPEKASSPERTESAGNESSVAWEVALVRDTPKTGNLLTRLPRGTKVKVGPTRDGWYQIKYGDGFASEGWVYRGAIGR